MRSKACDLGDEVLSRCRGVWARCDDLLAELYPKIDKVAAMHRYLTESHRTKRRGRTVRSFSEHLSRATRDGTEATVRKAKARFLSYVVTRLQQAGKVETRMDGRTRMVRATA